MRVGLGQTEERIGFAVPIRVNVSQSNADARLRSEGMQLTPTTNQHRSTT